MQNKKTDKMKRIQDKIAKNMKQNIQRRKNFEDNVNNNEQSSVSKSSSIHKKKEDEE